jgi:hypothetical protein
MTSKIPRCTSLTCEEESVLSIFGRQRVRFARFVGRRVATRDNEVCLSGRLGDRFGRFPGCMNVSASRPSAAGRGKLSGRRRRSSTTNWQKGKFDVIGQWLHQLRRDNGASFVTSRLRWRAEVRLTCGRPLAAGSVIGHGLVSHLKWRFPGTGCLHVRRRMPADLARWPSIHLRIGFEGRP